MDDNQVRIVEKNLHKRLQEKLKNAYEQQDILLQFMMSVEQTMPMLHFVANIVLMIWLSQTLLSSNMREVPRSLYLISPLFPNNPIGNIESTSDGRCPSNYQYVSLGTTPSVEHPLLFHHNLTFWKEPGINFCLERLRFLNSTDCPKPYRKCSGYCISQVNKCPVTAIRVIRNQEQKAIDQQVFYSSNQPKLSMVLSRRQGVPIVALATFARDTCAQQYYFNDEFTTLKQFTDKLGTKPCQEGNLNQITKLIDTQPYRQLMKTNGYSYSYDVLQKFSATGLDAKLVSIYKIDFHEDTPYCKGVKKVAQKLSSILPVSPQLPQAKPLLATALFYILMSLLWWIAHTCGMRRLRLQSAVILSAIELFHFILIKAKYSPYLAIDGVNQIQNCVKGVKIQALSNWSFGISNPYIFRVVVFQNTVFLSFHLVCWVLLRILYREI